MVKVAPARAWVVDQRLVTSSALTTGGTAVKLPVGSAGPGRDERATLALSRRPPAFRAAT